MNAPQQAQEQLRYARWIDWGTRLGLLVLVTSFVAYAVGWPAPRVPVQRLPELWSLPVEGFLQATGTPAGWGWLAQLGHGDMLGLLGIAVLAGCSVPALLGLVPLFWTRGDRALALLCAAEVAVLLLAASGLLMAGH